jgi:hypothetical protein
VKKTRKHYTGEEKVAILRRHLLEKEAISKLCDKLGLQPTVFYRWLWSFYIFERECFVQRNLMRFNPRLKRVGLLILCRQTDVDMPYFS